MESSNPDPLEAIGTSVSDRRYDGDAYDLPEPSAPKEGRVECVGMNHRNGVARALHTSDCQACGEPVRWDREHVLAMVTLKERMGYVRPRFCDRDCWVEWTSRP